MPFPVLINGQLQINKKKKVAHRSWGSAAKIYIINTTHFVNWNLEKKEEQEEVL